MIEAVIAFAVINVLGELTLISFVPPKYRLRLLGSHSGAAALHLSVLVINLVIHFGTVTGTMASMLSFVMSVVTVGIAKKLFGYVVDGRYYHVGWVKYAPSELR